MRPDRAARAALGALLVALGACTPVRAPETPPAPVGPPFSALELEGSVRGPVPGLGPRLDLVAWVRADGWIRCDLRFEDDRGRPAHEVLIWGPDTALLFDRRSGRFTELGEEAGSLEALGTAFRSPEAVWMALGRLVRAPSGAEPAWNARDGEWRGVTGNRAWRRPLDEPPSWWELAWSDGEGRVHALRATAEQRVDTPWGGVPKRLSVDGDVLEGRLIADWTVNPVPALGDSIFDPLWEPEGR